HAIRTLVGKVDARAAETTRTAAGGGPNREGRQPGVGGASAYPRLRRWPERARHVARWLDDRTSTSPVPPARPPAPASKRGRVYHRPPARTIPRLGALTAPDLRLARSRQRQGRLEAGG